MIMGCGGKKEPTPDLFSPEKSILPLVIPRCRDEAAGSSEGIPKERLFRNRLSARVERGRLQFLEGLRPPLRHETPPHAEARGCRRARSPNPPDRWGKCCTEAADCRKVLDILAEKYPQAYFGGAVALAKSIKWETAEGDLSDGAMTPDEIIPKLEQRVGSKGRKLF